ncbi:MAG: Protease Do [Candidatus Gottesmanbacteria bacterium GW2011_GWC2_39_8]|uniref:Protease Do n=1 Tax=Candidatus Gottesmanbacteria bacterium GW2011_GWC2_39_8 TaxID=1618450 RepID=A0A0G0Q296_9BACT|nr:MAG: Protease Do [Candidatus Gottesmanbacteria bacterium GW2011_GWC2_39_8]
MTALILTLSDRLNLPPLASDIKKNPAGEKVKVVTEESATVAAVKKVGPSVVTIIEKPKSRGLPILGIGGGGGEAKGKNSSQEMLSVGSGFIVSSEGLIVTNKHVVNNSGEYIIVTANDKKYTSKEIYRDPHNDVAVIKINPDQNPDNDLPAVTLASGNQLEVGQFVIAIGNALGQFKNTVTTGVISGLGRGIRAGDVYEGEVEDLKDLIQTSAAINPGSSGGPLVNSEGQVVGINTALAAVGQNIGFALPINVVKKSMSML